jgi:hypothetical protein
MPANLAALLCLLTSTPFYFRGGKRAGPDRSQVHHQIQDTHAGERTGPDRLSTATQIRPAATSAPTLYDEPDLTHGSLPSDLSIRWPPNWRDALINA